MNCADSLRLASWIAGLMRENYEAVGFIPEPTVAHQYLANDRAIIANDERGRRAGYLLHGLMIPGRSVNVSQHCISDELRRNGYGEQALRELVLRAERHGVSAISVRCATDLPSLSFWQGQGFRMSKIIDGGQKRNRQIGQLWLPLNAPLWNWERP